MKRTSVLWITALVLGWCFDFLFWKQGMGINFALYVALCLGGGFLVLALNGIKPAWRSLLLLIPILFFAAVTFIRRDEISLLLSYLLTLGLMALLAVSYLGGRWSWYGLSDYVANYLKLVGSMLARPFIFLSETRKAAAAQPTDGQAIVPQPNRPGWKRFWAILRGILIALPIVAIFAALLSSADLVFAQRLNDFTKLFRLENLPEYIFRVVYILIGAYALAGVFLHAARKSQDEKLLSEKPLIPQFMGFTEAAIVLGAVSLLFLLFVLIQFRYFFGGGANIGLQGYTYSEYARRGFGELVGVAFCSLLLFLGLSSIVNRRTQLQRRAFSSLGIGMVVLVGVILVSAFQRMILYEAAYGFSRLRIYTHIFMIWLGVLLAVVVVLEFLRRERLFPLAALLATIGFAATLALINVDGSIVRQNVRRAENGSGLDVAYLASLSTDSVPALIQAYQSPRLSAATRDAAGAALACRAYLIPYHNPVDWRAFTLSGFQSEAALKHLQPNLKKYTTPSQEWPVTLTSPNGTKFDCSATTIIG
jgi:hypothetical protein